MTLTHQGGCFETKREKRLGPFPVLTGRCFSFHLSQGKTLRGFRLQVGFAVLTPALNEVKPSPSVSRETLQPKTLLRRPANSTRRAHRLTTAFRSISVFDLWRVPLLSRKLVNALERKFVVY